jgi:hypothetical protein
LISKNFLIELSKILNQHDKDIIAGDVKIITNSSNPFEIYDLLFGFNLDNYQEESTGITANLTIKDSCFKYLTGFDPYESGADRNFCKKAKKNNFSYLFADHLVVGHPARKNLGEHKLKSSRIARGQVKYISKLKFQVKFFFILKNIIGAFVQYHQLKILIRKRSLLANSKANIMSVIIITFYLGFLSRFYAIKYLLK